MQYYRAQIEDTTVTRSEKIEYYDSLLVTNPSDRPSLLYRKGVVQRLNGNATEALATLKQAYACGPLLNESDRLESLYTISQLLFDSGKPIDAIREASRLRALPKPDSLKYYNAKAWLTVYNIYMSLGSLQRCSQALSSAMRELEIAKPVTEESTYRKIYGVILIMKGSLNTWGENYQEAHENFKEASDFLDKKQQGMLNLSVGNLYSKQKQNDISLGYYRRAMEDPLSDGRNRAAAHLNYIVNLVDLKRFDDALSAYEQYDSELAALRGTPEEFKLWSIASEAYEGRREWQKALEYRNKAMLLRDSLSSDQVKFEVDNTLSEINEMSSQEDFQGNSFSNQWKNGWFIGAFVTILLLGTAGVIIFIISRKSRKNVEELNRRLMDSENEVSRLCSVEDERNQVRQELAVSKARLSHISEALDQLKKVASNPKTHKSDIIGAVEKTTRSVSADSQVWEPFMAYAEGANQAFFDKLYRLHPELSNSETRMCAFMLLGRTTKEIATILNRSPRTVESIKYSLRVKMRIKDMTTEQYLRKISSTPLDELCAGSMPR